MPSTVANTIQVPSHMKTHLACLLKTCWQKRGRKHYAERWPGRSVCKTSILKIRTMAHSCKGRLHGCDRLASGRVLRFGHVAAAHAPCARDIAQACSWVITLVGDYPNLGCGCQSLLLLIVYSDGKISLGILRILRMGLSH